MTTFSLKTKISAIVCLLLAVILALEVTAILRFFGGEFRRTIGLHQFELVRGMALTLDQQLEQGRNLIVRTAATLTPSLLKEPDSLQAFLDQQLGIGTQEFFDNGVFVFSPQGILLAEWPFKEGRRGRDYSFRDYFRRTVESRQPVISDPYFSSQAHGHPAINFTAPVFTRDGHLAAVLAGSLDLTKPNFLGGLAATRIGRTGYFYLYNTDRLMIMHPDGNRILKKDVPLGSNRLFDQAITGFEGSGETVNSRGIPMLASFKRLATTNWILACNLPQKEAYAPLTRAAHRALLGALTALVLGTLVVWLVMRRQVRPVIQLTSHVQAISRQTGLRRPIEIRRRDEIGTLARAFNALMEEVNEQTALSADRLAFLQAIIDSIPLPVFYKDRQSRYLGCNTAFELAIGVSRQDLLGKTVQDILPPDLADLHRQIDESILPGTGSIVRSFEQRLSFADGEIHDVVFFKSVFRNRKGEAAGLVGTMIDITERKSFEDALNAQREFSENLLQNSAVACFVLDRQHHVLSWTRACEELTGVPPHEVLGTDLHWKAFYPDARPCLADLVLEGSLERTLDLYQRFGNSQLIPDGLQAEGWFPHVGGRTRYLFFEAAPVRNQLGEIIAAIETLQDLTTLKQAENSLRESEESLRDLIDRSPDAILVHRQGKIIFGNQAAVQLFKAGAPERLAGLEVLGLVHPEDRALVGERIGQVEEQQAEQSYIEERLLRLDGTFFHAEASYNPVYFGGHRAVQTVLRDITARKEQQEKFWRQANFDPLTGIPNRLLFQDRLRQAVERARREDYEVALLFIDLDKFKEINDTLGHEAGDHLLREAAARLQRSVRKSDTLARLGGDEFTVIMPCVTEPPHVSLVARRILAELERPFDLPEGLGRISGSIGIALFPRDGDAPADLVKRADAAMYRSKQGGRNAFCFYGEESLNQSPETGQK